MNQATRIVLCCGEGDDFDLIDLVHRARQRGVELRVVAGVERDAELIRAALRANPAALLVLVTTERLDLERSTELTQLALRECNAQQDVMTVELDLDEPEETLGLIDGRFARLTGSSMVEAVAHRPGDDPVRPPARPATAIESEAVHTPSHRRPRSESLRFLAGLLGIAFLVGGVSVASVAVRGALQPPPAVAAR